MAGRELISRLNLLGLAVGGEAYLINLDPRELIDAAILSTGGLNDFGDSGLPEGYFRLCRPAQNLGVISRLRLRSKLLISLRNRLLVVEKIKKSPEILSEAVEPPIVITGNPRTGTSILFELLAQDSNFRTVLTWEANFPVDHPAAPSPKVSRAELSQAVNDIMMDLQPGLRVIHEFGANLPAECFQIMDINFRNASPVLEYEKWKKQMDAESCYAWHKKILQVLQYNSPKKQWLLKCPTHLHFLEDLLKIYPGAKIIYTHRDPVKSMPSMLSLRRQLLSVNGNVHSIADSGMALKQWECASKQVIQIRADRKIPERNIKDVKFSDFSKDPMMVIRDIYAFLGRDFNGGLQEKMSAYLAKKPRSLHGRHSYSSSDFGLVDAVIRKQFCFYTDHYAIQQEG